MKSIHVRIQPPKKPSAPHKLSPPSSFHRRRFPKLNISRYDSLEVVRMNTQQLLESLKQLCTVVEEASPDMDQSQVFYAKRRR